MYMRYTCLKTSVCLFLFNLTFATGAPAENLEGQKQDFFSPTVPLRANEDIKQGEVECYSQEGGQGGIPVEATLEEKSE